VSGDVPKTELMMSGVYKLEPGIYVSATTLGDKKGNLNSSGEGQRRHAEGI